MMKDCYHARQFSADQASRVRLRLRGRYLQDSGLLGELPAVMADTQTDASVSGGEPLSVIRGTDVKCGCNSG